MSFGSEVPDQFAQIAAAVGANIAIAQDLATIFLTEFSTIEREYAQRLQALVKKARAARDKRLTDSIVGPDPSKAWSPDTARRSTLHTFLNALYSSTEQIAGHHAQAADGLTTLSTELGTSAKRKEDNRKRQTQCTQQLITERDDVYASRAKAKSKYDELCGEVESARQKREKMAADDKHADRAAKQFEQAEVDMWNGKNAYIIAIAKANASKTKFYRQNLPAAQDALQRLWSVNTSRLASILTKALTTQKTQADGVQTHLAHAIEKAASVKPAEDAHLFIEYNHRRFTEPSDWSFEPCQGFFDTAAMTIEGSPKTVLQNVLLRDRKRLAEMTATMESKRRELAGLEELCDAYQSNENLGSIDDVMDNFVDSRRQFSSLDTSKALVEVEMAEISKAIGDDEGEARPHRFKHQAFAVPTTCNFCGGTIWGLSKQGSVCKPCGFTTHIKCEIKVPANCGSAKSASSGAPSSGNSSTHARSNSVQSGRSSLSSSSSSATTTSRATHRPTQSYSDTTRSSASSSSSTSRMTMSNAFNRQLGSAGGPLRARVLYSFDATSPLELSVRVGQVAEVVEDDEDGDGWMKVKAGNGEQGLVPTTYVELLSPGEDDGLSSGEKGIEDEDDDDEQPNLGDLDGAAIENGTGGAGGTLKGVHSPAELAASLAASVRMQDDWGSSSSSSLSGSGPSHGRVRALYDFAGGGNANELPIKAGEVAELTAAGFEYAEGWCEGTIRGRMGIFPAAYVERI
ncbi:Protein BZZ1 [Tilletia horrida]|nr:Protein BZZ1 [Tilletia horrida]